MAKKYDTSTKKLRFLQCEDGRGCIVTFKQATPGANARLQMLGKGLEINEATGEVKILGVLSNSKWFTSQDELFEAINWEWMEEAHGGW